jgi:hypothetical protein
MVMTKSVDEHHVLMPIFVALFAFACVAIITRDFWRSRPNTKRHEEPSRRRPGHDG